MRIYDHDWGRVLFFYLLAGVVVLVPVGVVMTVQNIKVPSGVYVTLQYYGTGIVGLFLVKLRSDYEHVERHK